MSADLVNIGSTNRSLRISSIAYLASDDATFVHGARMRVDGGRLGRL